MNKLLISFFAAMFLMPAFSYAAIDSSILMKQMASLRAEQVSYNLALANANKKIAELKAQVVVLTKQSLEKDNDLAFLKDQRLESAKRASYDEGFKAGNKEGKETMNKMRALISVLLDDNSSKGDQVCQRESKFLGISTDLDAQCDSYRLRHWGK